MRQHAKYAAIAYSHKTDMPNFNIMVAGLGRDDARVEAGGGHRPIAKLQIGPKQFYRYKNFNLCFFHKLQ